MGCFSSKLLATTDLEQGIAIADRRRRRRRCSSSSIDSTPNHVVSLTSTTYGALNVDRPEAKPVQREWKISPPLALVAAGSAALAPAPEVIDARELMCDLADETPRWSPMRKRGGGSSSKFLTPATSPRKQQQKRRLFSGKENDSSSPKPPPPPPFAAVERPLLDRNRAPKPFTRLLKSATPSPAILRESPNSTESSKLSASGRRLFSGKENDSSSPKPLPPFAVERPLLDRRRSPKPFTPLPKSATPIPAILRKSPNSTESSKLLASGPLFDPELVAAFEREHREEQMKNKKTVVLYTTTLRGIRKTFEDCNAVRAAVVAHGVGFSERDVSMDAGFREELRELLVDGAPAMSVVLPALFVGGSFAGGAKEVMRMEEEGELGVMLEGLPAAAATPCRSCGGARFVMCEGCRGSCRVVGEDGRRTVRCGECNENGLRCCPKCC